MSDAPEVPVTLAERLAALRVPFPAETVGKLPKPYRKDSPKGECKECGGYHGLPAMHLDYVGHAVVTSRLLEVDPQWSWEPFALADNGLPLIVNGVLWIRLTVLGVTRIGVGDGPDPKQLISDAIRNAAMRFGCALNLWSKTEIDPEPTRATFAPPAPAEPEPKPKASTAQRDTVASVVATLTEPQSAELKSWWKANLHSSMKSLTSEDADKALAHLEAVLDAEPVSDDERPF